MLLAFLLASVGSQAGVRTLTLSLGANVPDGNGGSYRYESVEDTTLDRNQPDHSEGGDFLLSGGRDKTILIRFGDLERVLGNSRHIRKATLILSIDSATKPELTRIAQLLEPWGEGPLHVVGAIRLVPTKPGGPVPISLPAVGSATWKDRRSGSNAISWSLMGAQGGGDGASIDSAKGVQKGDEFEISGLESSVQFMANHPLDNHGFALSFGTTCDFVGSQDKTRRPRLILEVEPEMKPGGADLSVTRIDRTPTFDVVGNRAEPDKGEVMTYTAHVKNQGTTAVKALTTRWSLGERSGAAIEVTKPIAAGAEVTFTTAAPYEPTPGDHRGGSVRFTVTATGDIEPRNDSLEINANAKAIGLTVEKSFADAVTQRGQSLEDWAQAQMRVVNETYLPHSRFSFAPAGVLERYRIQAIQVIPDGTLKDQRPGEDLDAVIVLSAEMAKGNLDAVFMPALGRAVGLANLGAMNLNYDRGAGRAPRISADRFGGVMGGGDTRFDGGIAKFFVLPYEPYSNPIFDNAVLDPTGLFSATDVAALNAGIDRRGKVKGSISDVPSTVVIKAVGLDGKPLTGAELNFFQSKGGKIDDGAPAFTLVTDAVGTASLPNRAAEPRANPFGPIAEDGSNGLFLVRAAANGASEYGWLKAWQLADAYHRTGQLATIFELRFSLPSEPLDEATNLAEGRVLKDSAGSLPAKLAGLVDGSNETEVTLPAAKGAWIEVDLGRDRPVGEIRLVMKNPQFWSKFDIVGYATGQDAGAAAPWSKEIDWDWTKQARAESEPGGGLSIAYRGSAGRFRYIRLVSRDDSDSVFKLAELKVVPVRSGG